MVLVHLAAPAARGDRQRIRVRPERPRIWLRASEWDGPTTGKLAKRLKLPEYRRRLRRLRGEVMGKALLYLAARDADAGRAAAAALKGYSSDIEEDRIRRQCAAALFDWFHDHPDFDEAARKAWIGPLEQWAEKDMARLSEPGSPFYTTMTRRLAAFTCRALALHGDSPKAERFVQYAGRRLRETGTMRLVEDGAAGRYPPEMQMAAWRIGYS